MIESWPDHKNPSKMTLPEGTVAIVMPVRSQIKHVQLAYYSVRYFTDVPYVFAFVNNQSNLETKKTLAGISKNHRVWLLDDHREFDKAALVNTGLRFFFQNKNVKYGCVIDSDVVVGPDWMTKLLEFLNSKLECGIVSPQMPHRPKNSFGEVTGSCAVFHKGVYEQLGGFPEGVGDTEMIEFCSAVEELGLFCGSPMSTEVYHFGGITRRAEEHAVKLTQSLSTSKEGRYEQRIKVG